MYSEHAVSEMLVLICDLRMVLTSVVKILQPSQEIHIFARGGNFEADFNILVQVVMGIALIVGAFLARAKRYAAHGICQTSVLLLNVAMIAGIMWPSFSS